MKKKWKYIPNFSNYLVSNYGEILTLPGKRGANNGGCGYILSPRENQQGYYQVGLINDSGKKQFVYVHRAVASAWLPKKHNQKDCNVVMHLDDNPSNNHMNNLKWGTQFLNMRGVAERAMKKGKRESIQISTEKVLALLQLNKNYDGRKIDLIQKIADELELSPQYVNIIIYTFSYRYPHLREKYKDVLKEKRKKS